jgi:hypothetical protein
MLLFRLGWIDLPWKKVGYWLLAEKDWLGFVLVKL